MTFSVFAIGALMIAGLSLILGWVIGSVEKKKLISELKIAKSENMVLLDRCNRYGRRLHKVQLELGWRNLEIVDVAPVPARPATVTIMKKER